MKEQSNLIPFLRPELALLFVGLNPANGSSRNRHYFSVNASFWNQLYASGLITRAVDKASADENVFGDTEINCNGWNYGITDLLPAVAESDSSTIQPTRADCIRLCEEIQEYQPLAVVLLHRKVVEQITEFCGIPLPPLNSGEMGQIIPGCPSMFFNIAFPHGNIITAQAKIERYRQVREYLLR